MKLSFWHPPL